MSLLKKALSKITDIFIIFASLFAIAMFIIVLMGSVRYWQYLFKGENVLNAKLYLFGIIIAIIHAITNWVVEFIKEFAKAFKNLFSKKEVIKNE